jgi:hypothetical protein
LIKITHKRPGHKNYPKTQPKNLDSPQKSLVSARNEDKGDEKIFIFGLEVSLWVIVMDLELRSPVLLSSS